MSLTTALSDAELMSTRTSSAERMESTRQGLRKSYMSALYRTGDEYIIHGLFGDDMMHIYSCNAVKDEFLALYKKDFDITGGIKMKTFLGMVEQSSKSIKIHLDNYVKDVVAEYADSLLNTSRRFCAPRRCRSLQVSHSRPKMLQSSPIRLSRSTTAQLW